MDHIVEVTAISECDICTGRADWIVEQSKVLQCLARHIMHSVEVDKAT